MFEQLRESLKAACRSADPGNREVRFGWFVLRGRRQTAERDTNIRR